MYQGKFGKNKVKIIIISALFFCLIACWIIYAYYGHCLIKAIYDGNSIKILNRVIEGQANNPLRYYIDRADRTAFRCGIVLFLLLVVTSSLSFGFNISGVVFFILVYSAISLFSYNLHLQEYATHPDATNYISCAEYLLQGKGFLSSGFNELAVDRQILTGIEEDKPLTGALHPYAPYGPLYPSLIATIMYLIGTSALNSAFIINHFFFSLTITLTYLALVQIDPKRFRLAASVISILLILYHPLSYTLDFAMTEMTYIGLSLSAIFLMHKYYNCQIKYEAILIFSCSLITALVMLCRYIGATVLITGLVLILSKNGYGFTKRKIITSLIFISISLLPFLPWLIRNKMVVGSFMGGYPFVASGSNFLQDIYLLIALIATAFLRINNPLIIGMILLSLLILAYRRRKKLKIVIERNAAFILYPIIYLSTLIILRRMIHISQMERRIFPIYPFIIILFFAFFYHILIPDKYKK